MAGPDEGEKLAPLKTWLVDTGPLVAYLDSADAFHGRVAECLDPFSGTLVTSSAVITETMHFLADSPGGPSSLAQLVSESRMRVFDVCQPSDLREAARRMERYSDTPMDFADATLVLLAEALDLHDILTLDRRGFSTYRTDEGDGFRLVLEPT